MVDRENKSLWTRTTQAVPVLFLYKEKPRVQRFIEDKKTAARIIRPPCAIISTRSLLLSPGPALSPDIREDHIRTLKFSGRPSWRKRAAALQSRAATNLPPSFDLPLYDGLSQMGNYYVELQVGTPAVTQLLVFDTGSDLVWTQVPYPPPQPSLRSVSTSILVSSYLRLSRYERYRQ